MRVKSWQLSLLFVFSTVIYVFPQSPKPADNWAKFDDTKIHYYDIDNLKSKNALVLIHCVASIAPKSDFQIWTGVSHFLHMERPAEFNGQVKAFVVSNKLL